MVPGRGEGQLRAGQCARTPVSTCGRPAVDVVVVTYGTRDLTVAALGRILALDDPVTLRLLVHDNASPDGTAAAVATAHPEVDVVAGAANLGFAGGVNRALARTTAPWVLLLNSDAWPDQGAIAQLVDTARHHADAAIIAPRLLRPDGTLEHSTHPFPSARVAVVMALGAPGWTGRRRLEQWCIEGHWDHDERRTVDWAVGAAWLVRRAALEAVGPLDERFFMYGEDLEWCWRARRAGWSVVFEPAAVVRHVGNASGGPVFGEHRTAAHLRNTLRFYRRTHGAAATILYRALTAVGCARMWARDRLAGNTRRAAWWGAQVRVMLQPVGGSDAPPDGRERPQR